jgi:S-adenosylmethionine synthetase
VADLSSPETIAGRARRATAGIDGRDQSGIDESAPYPARWLCHYPHSKALAAID